MTKPKLRGHFHQAAFFFWLGACVLLLSEKITTLKSTSSWGFVTILIYSISLCGLFGMSALYHRPQWSEKYRLWMRRLDHSFIFFLIAGTATPLSYFALPQKESSQLLITLWIVTFIGVLKTLFWVKASKLLSALLYILTGWLTFPYFADFKKNLGPTSVYLLLAGGIIYSIGGLIYAFKKPNPWPLVLGYHEIFHLLVIIAAGLHFIVVYRLG